MDVVLIRVTKNGVATQVPLTRPKTLIGRLDDCHIRVPVAGISRKHCEITISDGSIVVSDLGSSNGTYVNQEKVTSEPVSAGDLISFGGLVFLVTVNGEPGDIDVEMMYEDGIPEAEDKPSDEASEQKKAPVQKMVATIDSNDESSMVDFDFDFDDDDDDQPPL